ncbi:carboxymuconolactone decarboxylase family protein [Streptomyces sp. BR1]|uniref:carboxymuconolactone decarboxylase family protein n=1 Tax=Streptomyces sp. BR1 TaxID=1592323 RepID=UPI00402BCAE5
MTARITPLEPPYEPETAALLHRMMPGSEPIGLFRALVRNVPLAEAMQEWGSYVLGRGLSVGRREREIVILRTCARRGCAYEWGVHVAHFADRVGLDEGQVASLAGGGVDDVCWTGERDRLLIELVDSLCDTADVDDALWARLTGHFGDEQLLDLLVLCGWYHAVSFVARASRLEPEPGAPALADRPSGGSQG